MDTVGGEGRGPFVESTGREHLWHRHYSFGDPGSPVWVTTNMLRNNEICEAEGLLFGWKPAGGLHGRGGGVYLLA